MSYLRAAKRIRLTRVSVQLQKMNTEVETIQTDFDNLKDHLQSYITQSTKSSAIPPKSAPKSSSGPTRHISHLTQMAAKALHRDVPGMNKPRIRPRGNDAAVQGNYQAPDELAEAKVKQSWKEQGLHLGMQPVDDMREAAVEIASIEDTWSFSWDRERAKRWVVSGERTVLIRHSSLLPQRIPLRTKLTKRCPHSACRHLLIQPDPKSTRFRIKMVAGSYLPAVEIGRRRRKVPEGDLPEGASAEEIEKRRRDRRRTRDRGDEEDEDMDKLLRAGQSVSSLSAARATAKSS